MEILQEHIQQYVAWEPPSEQALHERVSIIEAKLSQARQKSMDKLDVLQLDYLCRVFEEQTQLKFSALKKISKEAVSDLGVLQILEQITRIVTEENTKADAILSNIKQSTDVLRTVGVSHDQISNSAAVGRTLTGEIRQHEARDKLIIGGLFGVFVLTSIIIILRRVWKVAGPILRAGRAAAQAAAGVAGAAAKLLIGDKKNISTSDLDILETTEQVEKAASGVIQELLL